VPIRPPVAAQTTPATDALATPRRATRRRGRPVTSSRHPAALTALRTAIPARRLDLLPKATGRQTDSRRAAGQSPGARLPHNGIRLYPEDRLAGLRSALSSHRSAARLRQGPRFKQVDFPS
jgi:hypothetical protein